MAYLLGLLKAFGLGLVKNVILKPLATVVSVSFMWSFNALVKASPGRAAGIAKKITEVYFDLSTPWAQFVSSYVEQLTGKRINVGDLVGKSIGGVTDGASREFVNEIFSDILNLVMPSPEESARNPLAGGERFLSANLKFQMDAWWLHVLGDMVSFGIFKSLKDLPNAISWAMGLGWLSWLVMGTPFQISIVGPMERHFNKIYGPKRLAVGQLIEATQKGLINAEEFIKQMKEAGYTPELATTIYQLSRKELSRAELQRLYDLKMIKSEDLLEQLKSIGYPENIAGTLHFLMTSDRVLDLKGKIASEVLELYSEKKLSDTDLTSYYEGFGYTPEEIEYVKLLGQLRMDSKPKLTAAEMIPLFRSRILGYSEILQELQARGYNEREAILYVLAHVPQDDWKGLIPDAWFARI